MNNPYWYELPAEKIAQRPCVPYDAAKMCVVQRGSGELTDGVFREIADFLEPGDLLVMNNTKVIPARLYGELETGASIEILLERQLNRCKWHVLGKPLKKFKPGVRLLFANRLIGVVGERKDVGVEIEFSTEDDRSVQDALHATGTMPIPPYIRKGKSDERDLTDYQTHFARHSGSIAAPTASLHFTPDLLQALEGKGVRRCELTLHVGTASFLPLFEEGDQPLRKPGEERYVYSSQVLETIRETRASGKKVIAVGTTTVRALESLFGLEGEYKDGEELLTELFITPGYTFKAFDALVTNFHQPGTTHLLLVEAFLGRELLTEVYTHALGNEYRFLSYGDGMLLL